MNTDKIYAEHLANEYAPKDTSKVVALRKLDARAKFPATIFTYPFGIIAFLVTGVGMCLSMKVIGSGTTFMFVVGVILGLIGLFAMGINYLIYKKCWQAESRNMLLKSCSLQKKSARINHVKAENSGEKVCTMNKNDSRYFTTAT